jgi:hypothetical protein
MRPVVLLALAALLVSVASSAASPAAAPVSPARAVRDALSSSDSMSEGEKHIQSAARHADVLARLSQVKCIFSDLDGTLCHFDRHTKHFGVSVTTDEANAVATVRNTEGEERSCRLLPTSTMGAGVISDRTVDLVHQLRRAGVKFVIISGARSTTMMARYAKLPLLDAVACETGVKILYPPEAASMDEPPDSSVLALDTEWADTFKDVTGPLDSALPPEQREGSLWDLYRELAELGLEPDARGYFGCFRVNCRENEEKLALLRPFAQDEDKLAARGIAHAMNLGMYDFFPVREFLFLSCRVFQERTL